MALPKLEGRITVPTGGWSVSVTDNDGTFTATVAAGDYYLTSTTSLLTTFKTALDNGAGVTYTVTVNDADPNGTGKVTITPSAGNVAITWTSTGLRDALGFTGNLSAASSHTSANSSPHIWLPNTPRSAGIVPDGYQGRPVTDGTVTGSPTGTTKAIQYATRYENTAEWRFLLGSKTWITWESTVNESFEKFWSVSIGAGQPVRYHKDRADDSTYVTDQWLAIDGLPVVPAIPTFTGGATSLWNMVPVALAKKV
jgi:hypothetical protein